MTTPYELLLEHRAQIKTWKSTGDWSKDQFHALVGMLTELKELESSSTEANAKEELGDFAFFLNKFLEMNNIVIEANPLSTVVSLSIEELIIATQHTLIDLLDIEKAHMMYDRPYDHPKSALRPFLVNALFDFFLYMVSLKGFDLKEVLDLNIKKLNEIRYKNGQFSEEAANNRDLIAEQKALEGN